MKRLALIITVCILILVGCAKEATSWQEHYDLGVRYLKEGNYEEAIIAFTAAIEIDEKNTDAYMGRAEAYIASGETAEYLTLAMSDYETVISIDANYTDAYIGMADVYFIMEEYEEAVKVLNSVPDGAVNDAVEEKLTELERAVSSAALSEYLGLWSHNEYSDNYSVVVFDEKDGTVNVCVEAVRGNAYQIATAVVPNVRFENGEANFKVSDSFENTADCKIIIQNGQLDISFSNIQVNGSWGIVHMPEGHFVKTKKMDEIEEAYLDFLRGELGIAEEDENNEAPMGDVEVVEAVNVSKKVYPPSYAGSSEDFEDHNVVLPKIDGNTAGITAFNEKIMNENKKWVDALSGGCINNDWEADTTISEDSYLLHATYQYEECDGIIGILLIFSGGRFATSGFVEYKEYYFDTNTDEIIDFNECMKRLNISFDKMTSVVNDTLQSQSVESYGEEEPPLGGIMSNHRIEQAIFSDTGFTATYNRQIGLGGPTTITIDCPISEIRN